MHVTIALSMLIVATLVKCQHHQGRPPSYPVYSSTLFHQHQNTLPVHQQKSSIPHNHPIKPIHHIPNYMPNSDPQHKPEAHIFYDQNNQPYPVTAKNEQGRVGGDRAVDRWKYPFQVQIRNSSTFLCSGALLYCPYTRKQFVITAAHCLLNNDAKMQPRHKESLIIRAGNIRREGDEGQFLKVKKIVIHEDTRMDMDDPTLLHNDLALIFLDGDYRLSSHLKPIAIPMQGQPILAKFVSITGWGLQREDGNTNGPSSLLRVVHLPVIDQETCQRKYDGLYGRMGTHFVTDRHFCAGFVQEGEDTCQGDSGSPASAVENGQVYLVGIGSWGKGCVEKGYPAVYTKISSYIDWVKKQSYDTLVLGK